MPYIDGKRVSNEEWTERYGSIKQLHTGPDGANPAPSGEDVADTEVPKGQPKSAGGRRGKRSTKAAKAALADALGAKPGDADLDGLDLTGSDADADDGNEPTDDGDGADDTAGSNAADAEDQS